jgi:hypothetical protein
MMAVMAEVAVHGLNSHSGTGGEIKGTPVAPSPRKGNMHLHQQLQANLVPPTDGNAKRETLFRQSH